MYTNVKTKNLTMTQTDLYLCKSLIQKWEGLQLTVTFILIRSQ